MMNWRKSGDLRHSLSGKLVLLFIVMAILFVLFVGSGFRYFINYHFRDNVQPHIIKYLEYVQEDLGSPLNTQRAQQLADELNLEIHIIKGQRQWSSNRTQLNLSKIEFKHRHNVNDKLYSLVQINQREYLMTEVDDATLLFTVPRLRPERGSARGWLPIVILLVMLLLLYHSIRRLFSPIENIQAAVKDFGQGQLDRRIHINRRDELGNLADDFNVMADDIKQILEAKRQLLLAISHELRSPIARAKVACELLDDEEQKFRINRELDEMETLIEELLETERLASRHHSLNRSHQNLNKLISEVIETHLAESNIEVSLPTENIFLEIDAARIKLLVRNLLDNAILHTPKRAAPPKVILQKNPEGVTVQIIDYGEGIDEKHLPHLTDPFYRVDRSRQRDTGGYGLGLYLCKMIAESHNGQLNISSKPGKGTSVTLSLPHSG